MDQEVVLSNLEEAGIDETESIQFLECLLEQGITFEISQVEDSIENLNYDNLLESKILDPVKQYLMQIGEIPLLTSEEEIQLSQWIIEGQKADQAIHEMFVISLSLSLPEETHSISELQSISDLGLNAKSKLVSANLRLVVSIAKKYTKFGLPLLDLIQEGNLGLIKGAEKFDCSKGFKFSTYATWWIRQAITRSIADTSRTVRLPVHINDDLLKVRKVMSQLNQIYERTATYEEIANTLNQQTSQKKNYTVNDIEELLRAEIIPVSLESPIGENNDSRLEEFIEDKATTRPDHYTNQKELSAQIKKALGSLTEKEERIIKLRYGLEDGKSHTLEEIGVLIGLTRERIRQIEHKALKKLRQPERSKDLVEFYEGYSD